MTEKNDLTEIKDAVLKDEPTKAIENLQKFSDHILSELDKDLAGLDAAKPQDKSLFLQLFGIRAKVCILDFLIQNKGQAFSKTQIRMGARVSTAAFFRQKNNNGHDYNHFGDLVRLGVVKAVEGGQYKKYTLNTENKVAQALLDVEFALIEQDMEREKNEKGVVDE